MRFTISQVLLFISTGFLLHFDCCNSLRIININNNNKRSPLDMGFVSFNKFKTARFLNGSNSGDGVVEGRNGRHFHRWIPGHVRHHAYIPGHLDRVYLPPHDAADATDGPTALLVGTVLVHPEIYQPAYRSHYGGFGIGADTGGQGAGHGYHVLFNL